MEPYIPPQPHRRSEPESFRARSMTLALTVNDIDRSRTWYRDIAMFTVLEEHEREGKLVSVTLVAGNARIMLSQDDGEKGHDRTKGEGFSVYLVTHQDVDELAARMKERGATLEDEPADMPWGGRLFRLRDPDGFRLAISDE